MTKRDYYEVLGVNKDAKKEDIKKEYRKLVKKFHPDVNKEDGAEEKFKEVQEAYETLSDDTKRKAYDQYGHAGTQGFDPRSGNGAGYDYGYGGTPFDMGDIFNTFFGGGSGFGFDFGQGANKRDSGGESLRYRMRFTFEEAMRGGEYSIRVRREVKCSKCDGSGSKSGKRKTCPTCKGSGRERRVQNSFLGQISVMAQCSQCGGVGTVVEDVCTQCNGSGLETKEEDVKIKIPQGAYDGMILRFRDGGNAGVAGGGYGDLYIEIEVEPSEKFDRRGNDLYSVESIPIHTAVLGGKIDVETIQQKSVKLKIPTGTQPGTIFRIKGQGAPILGKEDARGDLYVRVDVKIPKRLKREEKKLWEELSNM